MLPHCYILGKQFIFSLDMMESAHVQCILHIPTDYVIF